MHVSGGYKGDFGRADFRAALRRISADSTAEFGQFDFGAQLDLVEQTRDHRIGATFALLTHHVGEFLQTVLLIKKSLRSTIRRSRK